MTTSTTISQNHQRFSSDFFFGLFPRLRGVSLTGASGGVMFGAVMRISFFFGKPGMGFLPASCRSATIRRPAAYEAAALPTELRRRNRLGMRGGGWAMRAKEFLPCGRLMPSAASCSRSGTQRFACDHWSHRAFAGIRTRTEQFLRLSPLPVGLRKHARTPLSQCSGGIRVSPRFALKPAVDALDYSLRHDKNHGLTPMLPRDCSHNMWVS